MKVSAICLYIGAAHRFNIMGHAEAAVLLHRTGWAGIIREVNDDDYTT